MNQLLKKEQKKVDTETTDLIMTFSEDVKLNPDKQNSERERKCRDMKDLA
ncbi:MAG: hypothetical protein ACYTFW_02855 [Planctomycetota bacterium]